MALNGTLGTVLQGVSQQQPRVRLHGQVSEQINMHSDVVRGLVVRPNTKAVEVFSTPGAGLKFDDVEIEGVKYTVGFKAGSIFVWDSEGNSFPVIVQDQDATDYMGDNMSFHVYDKTIYVSNKDVVVEEDSTPQGGYLVNETGLVTCLGGLFGRDLKIVMKYDDNGDEAIGSYTIPDTDPSNVDGAHIADKLEVSLENHANFRSASAVIRKDNVLWVLDANQDIFTLTTTDGDEGETLRVHVDNAKRIEDLSPIAPNRTLVKVDGEETADDDFYMEFDVEGVTQIAGGFGTVGTWRESVNKREGTSLNFKTMPHVLFKIAGDFYFERNLWQKRRAGDALSNPHPSFVGEKITDIGGFQSRLTFTAGASWVAGRTNQPADFYRKSVVAGADTDPIDIISSTESEVELKWQVPFDRDLLLMSEKHQFIISGEGALTPDNAGMVLTTDFEMAGTARPSSTGRTILFPFTVGAHAGIKEFFSSDEIATNGADNITETVATYIKGDVTQISTSTNFNTTLIRTDHVGSEHVVWVYKYLWEGIEKKQSSWSKWEFPYPVAHVYWQNSTIFIIMVDGTDYLLSTMDMDYPEQAIGYTPMLDQLVELTANASSEVTLSYNTAEFAQHTGCAVPSEPVTPVSITGVGPYVYTFNASTVPENAIVLAGIPYEGSVTPTMPFIRDRDGKVVTSSKLVVTDMIVLFDNSGTIHSTMSSKYRGDVEHSNAKALTANDPDDPDEIGIRDGEFIIPWGELSEWSGLTLKSIAPRPMTILEIEWRGQQFKRGKRV